MVAHEGEVRIGFVQQINAIAGLQSFKLLSCGCGKKELFIFQVISCILDVNNIASNQLPMAYTWIRMIPEERVSISAIYSRQQV